MTNDPKPEKKFVSVRIPLPLRIVSVSIIVEGLLGLLFFIAVGIFQLNDANFTGSIVENRFSGNFYSFYIILHIVIYSGIALSGLFLLRSRKIGFYLFIFNYLILTIFSFSLNVLFTWTALIIGFVFLAVLVFYYKKMI